MIQWIKDKFFTPKAEKVAAAIEEDVINGVLAYAKANLTKTQMTAFVAEFNARLAIGGMNMATAVKEALEAAKGDVQ